MDATIVNYTIIEPLATGAYIPFEMYVMVVVLWFVSFFGSLWIQKADDFTSILSAAIAFVLAWLTMFVEFHDVGTVIDSTTVYLAPYSYHPFNPYIATLWIGLGFVGLFNVWKVWHRNALESAKIREDRKFRGY